MRFKRRGSRIPPDIVSKVETLLVAALIAASPAGHAAAVAYGIVHGAPPLPLILVTGIAGYLPVELARPLDALLGPWLRGLVKGLHGKEEERARKYVIRYGTTLGVFLVTVFFGTYVTMAVMFLLGATGDRKAHLSALAGSLTLSALSWATGHTVVSTLKTIWGKPVP